MLCTGSPSPCPRLSLPTIALAEARPYTHLMPQYAAFLGHQPRISIAELAATIPDFTLERVMGKHVALFRSDEDLSQAHLRQWGGIYLLARRITENPVTLEDIPQLLANEVRPVRGKITFALRAIGVERPAIRRLYRTCKDVLKRLGRPSRYVGNERIHAAPALLRDVGIIDGSGGSELVLLQEGEEDVTLWVGKTVAAQDPDAYTKRDMEKPVRDTRVGLLPPKLAQVLLNMGIWLVTTGQKKTSNQKTADQPTILDPFCGTGVIPMECLLRGIPVIASDASLKAIHGCEKNLEWLRRQEDIRKTAVPSAIFKHDARKPFDFRALSNPLLKQGPSVIVTETSLGPALTARPNAKEAVKLRTENETLQINFLKNIAATLPGVPVVALWPVWYLKTGPLFLGKVWKILPELGFNPMLPPYAQPEMPDHFSLLYRRPDQIVGREIVLLRARR